MIQLKAPKYGWRLVRELKSYVLSKTAKDPWLSGKTSVQQFKKQVTKLMLQEQSRRCAYCGCRLHEDSPHRDHIAPKSIYPEWTFWPENLALACFACDSGRKKTFDPVVVQGKSYRRTVFSIVHPYLDDPVSHIEFAAEGLKVIIKPANCSDKGQQTINLFDLASPERSKERAKDALFDEDIAHLHGVLRAQYESAAFAIFASRLLSKT